MTESSQNLCPTKCGNSVSVVRPSGRRRDYSDSHLRSIDFSLCSFSIRSTQTEVYATSTERTYEIRPTHRGDRVCKNFDTRCESDASVSSNSHRAALYDR